MKKVFSLLITLAMLISTAVVPVSVSADADVWDGTAVDTEWAGEGTEETPYLITSAAELAGLAKTIADAVSTTESTDKMPVEGPKYENNSKTKAMYFTYTGRYFKLTTDIDLGENNEWAPIGRFLMRFNGVFDGDGHIVKNVYMRNEYSAMGLFGGTGSNARIIDLGVDGVDISTDVEGGNVVDYDADGDVTKSQGRVSGLGGLVGVMCPGGTANAPMLEGCFVKDAKIKIAKETTTSHYGMGGLLGSVSFTGGGNFYVKNCYVMNVDLASVSQAGALFGTNQGYFTAAGEQAVVNLTNCYAGGDIKLKSMEPRDTAGTQLYNFGYLYGRTNCTYTNSYVTTNAYAIRDSIKGNGEQYTDKAGIVSAFAALDGWSADNETSPISGGYPVLAWENTWSWDGKTLDSSWAATGDGSESDPYEIRSAAQLADFANKAFYAVSTSTDVPVGVSETASIYNSYTGNHFKLMADIDLGGNEWLPIGRHGMRFNGIFDGNNHVVKNLKMTTNYFGMGLFGATGSSVKIKNLGIEDANITFASKGYNGGVFDYYDGTNGNSELPNTDKTWTTEALYRADRTNGAGTLIGIFAGGTISNCYVKDTIVKNDGSSNMGIGGFLGTASGTITSGERATITITNSYVNGAELGGTVWDVSAFIGTLNYRASDYVPFVSLNAKNCYVTDFVLNGGTQFVFTTGANNSDLQVNSTNCYADSASCVTGYETGTSGTKNVYATVTDKAAIESGLVNGDRTFCLDSFTSPINGGYPVLGWEKTWTVEIDPMSFYKVTNYTDGTVTLIQSDSNVTGTVIVAVYDDTRFVNAATANAANGEIAVTGLTVETGNTIKVFVWDSMTGLTPLSTVYSPTV